MPTITEIETARVTAGAGMRRQWPNCAGRCSNSRPMTWLLPREHADASCTA